MVIAGMLRTHHQLRAIRKRRDRIKVHITHLAIYAPSLHTLRLPPPGERIQYFIPSPKMVKDAHCGLPIPLE